MTRRVAQDEVGADSGTPQEGAAEAIREALRTYGTWRQQQKVRDEANRSLDSLLAYIKQLEGERDAARLVPPLIRSTLEKAARLDMTKPPVTQRELLDAIELLPESPSFYSSVSGMEALMAAEARIKQLEGELHEEHCAIERVWADRKAETEKAVAAEARLESVTRAVADLYAAGSDPAGLKVIEFALAARTEEPR